MRPRHGIVFLEHKEWTVDTNPSPTRLTDWRLVIPTKVRYISRSTSFFFFSFWKLTTKILNKKKPKHMSLYILVTAIPGSYGTSKYFNPLLQKPTWINYANLFFTFFARRFFVVKSQTAWHHGIWQQEEHVVLPTVFIARIEDPLQKSGDLVLKDRNKYLGVAFFKPQPWCVMWFLLILRC